MLLLQPEIEASQAVKSDIIRETFSLVLHIGLLKHLGVLHYWSEHSFSIPPQILIIIEVYPLLRAKMFGNFTIKGNTVAAKTTVSQQKKLKMRRA